MVNGRNAMAVHSCFCNYLFIDSACELVCLFSLCSTVSTTVDPFRDISLDLAPHSVINRTSTPVETTGKIRTYRIDWTLMYIYIQQLHCMCIISTFSCLHDCPCMLH